MNVYVNWDEILLFSQVVDAQMAQQRSAHEQAMETMEAKLAELQVFVALTHPVWIVSANLHSLGLHTCLWFFSAVARLTFLRFARFVSWLALSFLHRMSSRRRKA